MTPFINQDRTLAPAKWRAAANFIGAAGVLVVLLLGAFVQTAAVRCSNPDLSLEADGVMLPSSLE